MTLQEFLNLFRAPNDPCASDAEGRGIVVDMAEGALRAGVTLTLAEYAAMTPELRRAWIDARARIERDSMADVPGAVSDILDEVTR